MARVDFNFKREHKQVAESMLAEGVVEKALRAFVVANDGATADRYEVRLEEAERGFQLRVMACDDAPPATVSTLRGGNSPHSQFSQAKDFQRANPTASRKDLLQRFGMRRSTAWRVRHQLRQEGVAVPKRGARK